MTSQLEHLLIEANGFLGLNDQFPGILPMTTVTLLKRAIKPRVNQDDQIAKLNTAIYYANLHKPVFDAAVAEVQTELTTVDDIARLATLAMANQLLRLPIEEAKWLRRRLRNFTGKVNRKKQPAFERFVARLDALLAVGNREDIIAWRRSASRWLRQLDPSYTGLEPKFVLAT